MKSWRETLDDLDTLYDKFRVNFNYKEKSWQKKEDYVHEQTKLSDKIEKIDEEILKSTSDIIHEVWPDVKIVKFSSVACSRINGILGDLLVSGLDSGMQCLELEGWFEKKTAYKMKIERFEDLSDEIQQRMRECESEAQSTEA